MFQLLNRLLFYGSFVFALCELNPDDINTFTRTCFLFLILFRVYLDPCGAYGFDSFSSYWVGNVFNVSLLILVMCSCRITCCRCKETILLQLYCCCRQHCGIQIAAALATFWSVCLFMRHTSKDAACIPRRKVTLGPHNLWHNVAGESRMQSTTRVRSTAKYKQRT